jgi:hypothetical protein
VKTRFRCEADDWTPNGSKINAPEKLHAIRHVLEHEGPIIVQHWFYRGASAPDRLVFDDYEEFTVWLNERTAAGDAIDVWSWAAVCAADVRLAEGKCPDSEGLVPRRGAY